MITPSSITRMFAAGAVLALAAFALAACGGTSDSTSTAASTSTSDETSTTSATVDGETISIAADPSGALQFDETDVAAKAGNDTVEFDNPSSTPHNVEIEDESGNDVAGTDTITASTTSTTADLQAGTYTFYCSIPGHREAGMEGTLTVK